MSLLISDGPLCHFLPCVVWYFSCRVQATGCRKLCVWWVRWVTQHYMISCCVQLRTGCDQSMLTLPTTCYVLPTTLPVPSRTTKSTSALPYVLILALFVCIAIVKQISEWSSRSVSCQCCNRCGGQTPYIWTVLIHIRYVICNVTYVCVNETLDVVLCMFTRVLMVGRW